MPNYCYNRLTIDGASDDLDKLAAAVRDETSHDPDDRFSYAKIRPVADGEDEGEAWGSTSVYCLKTEHVDGELVYEWESSWDPPLKVVYALAAQWPELRFEFVYCEPGTGRFGTRYLADGVRRSWSDDAGMYWETGDDEIREFLEDNWPALASKWWDEEEDDDARWEDAA